MGPHESISAALEGFSSSPQWTDNVVRKTLFLREHPEVEITSPLENGTGEFIASGPDGLSASSVALGWLMDELEQHFR
jgi:hypothetical protein